MRTLGSQGAAIVGIWKAIPAPVQILLVIGLIVLSGFELVEIAVHSINSPDLTRGQASAALGEGVMKQAEGVALSASIEDIQRRKERGQKVTIAEGTKLAEYEKANAEATVAKLNAELTAGLFGLGRVFLQGMLKEDPSPSSTPLPKVVPAAPPPPTVGQTAPPVDDRASNAKAFAKMEIDQSKPAEKPKRSLSPPLQLYPMTPTGTRILDGAPATTKPAYRRAIRPDDRVGGSFDRVQ
jgi:hypothetical protein